MAMSQDLVDLITAGSAGALLGLVIGFGLGWFGRKRTGPKQLIVDETMLAPSLDDEIDEAAREWATRHGVPDMSCLLADKVRVAWHLRYGNGSQERRR